MHVTRIVNGVAAYEKFGRRACLVVEVHLLQQGVSTAIESGAFRFSQAHRPGTASRRGA